MPVPTVITDLSTTAASNSPAGSDPPGPDGDNYFRAHAAFIAQLYAGKTSIAAGMLKSDGSAIAVGVAGTDYLAPAAIGVTVQAYDADIPTEIISQADAEAGTATDSKAWTAQRVAQAIAAQTNDPVLMTAQASTSGTSIVFGSIPAGVKRITVMLNGVSTNGTSTPILQIGDSGGIENTGYVGTGTASRSISPYVIGSSRTDGFILNHDTAAAAVIHGHAVLTHVGSNVWVMSGVLCKSDSVETLISCGSKTLSAELTQLSITTDGGTDTFDAGSINVLYE